MKKLWQQHKILLICIPCILIITGAVIGVFAVRKNNQIHDYVEEGSRYLSVLDYERAIASYQQALDISPKNIQANFGLAECYEIAGKTTYAESVYQSVLDRSPKNAEAYTRLAELYIREGKLDEARDLVDLADTKVKHKDILSVYSVVHPDTPVFSRDAGIYDERIRVALSTKDPMTIHYTTDGTDPTAASPQYTAPIILRNGLTAVKAIAVNTSGYESDIISCEYTVRIEDIEVTIDDPAVERVIRQSLSIPAGTPIYNDDTAQITALYIIGDFFSSTDPQTSVSFDGTSVILNNNQFRSTASEGSMKTVKDLKQMPFLETVVIAYQKELDISALSDTTGIKDLSLIGNHLTGKDLSALTALTDLSSLCLGWNAIDDISALASLSSAPSLSVLSLWGNRITDCSPLSGLTTLTYLDLSDNCISDLQPLSGISSLAELWIYKNTVRDIKPLQTLSALRVLMIRDNPISDPDAILPIYPQLRRLDVDLLNLGNQEQNGS